MILSMSECHEAEFLGCVTRGQEGTIVATSQPSTSYHPGTRAFGGDDQFSSGESNVPRLGLESRVSSGCGASKRSRTYGGVYAMMARSWLYLLFTRVLPLAVVNRWYA